MTFVLEVRLGNEAMQTVSDLEHALAGALMQVRTAHNNDGGYEHCSRCGNKIEDWRDHVLSWLERRQ
jgi:RNA polymerase-binding transcription factor DksA